MEHSRDLPASMAVLDALPPSRSELIDELGRRLVKQTDNNSVANTALNIMARRQNQAVLEFVESCIGESRLRN